MEKSKIYYNVQTHASSYLCSRLISNNHNLIEELVNVYNYLLDLSVFSEIAWVLL